MFSRSPDLDAKPKAKKWLLDNKEAGAIFMAAKDLLSALYTGSNDGYIDTAQVVQYRFNSRKEGYVVVTGRKKFASIEVYGVETRDIEIFKIFPGSMDADLENFLASFRNREHFGFALKNEIYFENEILDEFRESVEEARKLSKAERKKKIDATSGVPAVKTRQVAYHVRSPYVVAERLEIANGRCEKCGNPAPFLRDKGRGTPYLEVHHKIQLSKGGWDELENTEALCPNCHREKHYG
jgi:5-methylcytosine-specific restriction protein A